MKVILLRDVQGVGKAGAVASVADGYGNNYLIPRKLAISATPGNLRNLEQHRETIKRKQEGEKGRAESLSQRLEGVTLRLQAKAGEAGRLYGSITNVTIAEALASQHHVEVDRRAIVIPHPIKVIGEHEVKVHLHRDMEATLKVEIEAEAE